MFWENPDYDIDIDEILKDTNENKTTVPVSGKDEPPVSGTACSHNLGKSIDKPQNAGPEDVSVVRQSTPNQAKPSSIQSAAKENTIKGTGTQTAVGRPVCRPTEYVTQLLQSPVCTKAGTSKGVPTTPNIPNFGKKVLVRQRKFPGPAGLLPDKPLDSFDTSTLNMSESLCDASTDNLEEVVCSQSSTSNFTESPWLRLSADFELSGSSPLAEYTVAWIKRRATSRQLQGRKVPFLAVILKQIDHLSTDPAVVLEDRTGTINGTLHRDVVDEYCGQLRPGSALALHQVGVVSAGYPTRRHYLNITKNNLVAIYDRPDEDADDVRVTRVKEISVRRLVDQVESCDARDPKAPADLSSPSESNANALFNTVRAGSAYTPMRIPRSALSAGPSGSTVCANTPNKTVREDSYLNTSIGAFITGSEQLPRNVMKNKSPPEEPSNGAPALKKTQCDIPTAGTPKFQFRHKVPRFSNYVTNVLDSTPAQDNALTAANSMSNASSPNITSSGARSLSASDVDIPTTSTPKFQPGCKTPQLLASDTSVAAISNSAPPTQVTVVPTRPVDPVPNVADADKSIVDSIFEGFDCSSLFEDF